MKVFDTKLKDVKIIEPDVFEDECVFFTESYSEEKYKKLFSINILPQSIISL